MGSRQSGPSGSVDPRLALLQRCPLCQGPFAQTDAIVLESHHAHRTVHLRCPQCQAALLALDVSSPSGAGCIAMITDLSANDAALLLQRPAIGDDEILACHALLVRRGALERRLSRGYTRENSVN